MNKIIVALACSALFVACNSDPKGGSTTGYNNSEVSMSPQGVDQVRFPAPVVKEDAEVIANDNLSISEKKIIKDGNISLKTLDMEQSKEEINQLVRKFKSYYENEEFQNDESSVSYNLDIKVPAGNFEKFIADIERGKAEILSKSINARDVTSDYIDLTTRLNNKQAYLGRYKELLSKANSVKDILAVQENIRVLQEEIESAQGRLKYMNSQISYSTLRINLLKDKDFVYKSKITSKFSERIKAALSNGWQAIISFFLALIAIWPFLLLCSLVIYVFRKLKSRKSKFK